MIDLDIEKLETVLKTKLSDIKLFKTALTHRSYLNEHPGYENPSNERLEFLGDAVLQLLSSEYLYEKYPDSPEGDLTNFRAATVCTSSLAEEARRLEYGSFLFLSHGEEQSGGRDREYILANTFEAVLGALYLDKGIDFCREFVRRELLYKVEKIVKSHSYKDAKSKLQEVIQEKYGVTPTYDVLDSWGLDHEKTFKVGVFVNKEKYGEGDGRSKQRAEQAAALDALERVLGN
jgi:ribonuclease-3